MNVMADNEIMNEIESEIRKAKGDAEDFEIEIVDDPVQEKREEAKDVAEEQGDDYGPKVQKRIQKLVTQRREAEIQAKNIQEQNAQLTKRLERPSSSSPPSLKDRTNASSTEPRFLRLTASLTRYDFLSGIIER